MWLWIDLGFFATTLCWLCTICGELHYGVVLRDSCSPPARVISFDERVSTVVLCCVSDSVFCVPSCEISGTARLGRCWEIAVFCKAVNTSRSFRNLWRQLSCSWHNPTARGHILHRTFVQVICFPRLSLELCMIVHQTLHSALAFVTSSSPLKHPSSSLGRLWLLLSIEQLNLGECPLEMFLDRTDLSKTVDRHGTERCHVLSRSSSSRSFWTAARSCWTRPRSYKKRLKTVKTGLDRQERVVQACQNIRILRHSLSQPVFPCFHTVFPLFLACLQSFKGLSKHVRRSVEPRSRVCQSRSRPFLYFSHQNLLTDGQFAPWLVQHHQKIPLQHSFCSYKWKRHYRKPVFQRAHALRCCATHGPRAEDLKGDSTRVEKKARHKKLQQRLGDLPAAVLPPVSPSFEHLWTKMCLVICSVGWTIALNQCSDLIDELLLVREMTQVAPRSFTVLRDSAALRASTSHQKGAMDSMSGGAQFFKRRSI